VNGLGRIPGAIGRRGWLGALAAAGREVVTTSTSSLTHAQLFLARQEFRFQGAPYRYFVHRYNQTWRNERAVEVPIAWAAVQAQAKGRILEVGNVLAHYFPVGHDRVDKYEHAHGTHNVDVLDFRGGPYDLIVSISTLEHVGYDEQPREADKPLRAIAHLRSLLSPKGVLLATLPVGYNPSLDAALRDARVPFAQSGCLKRVSADNHWEEVPFADVISARMHAPFRGINGLVIATFAPGPVSGSQET